MEDHYADEIAYRYATWYWSRRFYAPPVKANILARLQPRRQAPREPDAALDPAMPFFHAAIHGYCDAGEMEAEAICFVAMYVWNAPFKEICKDQGCTRGTVYNRARKFVRLAWSMGLSLRRVQEKIGSDECAEMDGQNSAMAD